MKAPPLHVAAAAIDDGTGRYLLTRRHAASHQGGLLEFPGGKLEPGETLEQGLHRELREELDITPLATEPLIRITHHYADRSVLLDVHRVLRFAGTPRGMEGQPLVWTAPQDMRPEEFPAADRPIINALRLPDRCLITGEDPARPEAFLQRLSQALESGIRMVQLRAHPLNDEAYLGLAESALQLCRAHQSLLLLQRPADLTDWADMADGLHLASRQLMSLNDRPAGARWVGASCHDPAQLRRAQNMGLDYAHLSPVLATASHPEAEPIGWDRFQAWVEPTCLPVYALGGMRSSDLLQAKRQGAQGIAAIGAYWLH